VSATRIFLVTDYGLGDEFAGVLHAVIAKLAPDVAVIDLSHGVAPFDVAGGAALLARAVPHLGPGVVCAVVDPGVGGDRRAVAIQVDGDGPHHLVGPDNGVLTEAARALGIRRVVALRRAPDTAVTFEGRDVFAPAAALLATGTPLRDLGEPVDVDSLIDVPRAEVATRSTPDGHAALLATVRWIDRFGNVQLNVPGRAIAESSTVGVVVKGEDALVRVVSTFVELEPGTAGLLRDANDAVALVVAQGSAAARFDVEVGDLVELVGSFGPLC
jgi:S-adenosylmethionine hydrolase